MGFVKKITEFPRCILMLFWIMFMELKLCKTLCLRRNYCIAGIFVACSLSCHPFTPYFVHLCTKIIYINVMHVTKIAPKWLDNYVQGAICLKLDESLLQLLKYTEPIRCMNEVYNILCKTLMCYNMILKNPGWTS